MRPDKNISVSDIRSNSGRGLRTKWTHETGKCSQYDAAQDNEG
jgi:hypothetical protein